MARRRFFHGLLPALVAGLSIALGSCGNSITTLTGEWSGPAPSTVPGATTTRTLHLDADGTGSYRFDGGGTCSGTINYAGFHWTVMDTAGGSGHSVQFTAEPICSGTITCSTGDGADCNTIAVVAVGSCPYTLSNDGNTLELMNCFGSTMGTVTLARVH